MKIDLSKYNLSDDIIEKVQAIIDSENVTIESLVGVGVDEATAKDIFNAFNNTTDEKKEEVDGAEDGEGGGEGTESQGDTESQAEKSVEGTNTESDTESTESEDSETDVNTEDITDYKSLYEQLLKENTDLKKDAIITEYLNRKGIQFTSLHAKKAIIQEIKDSVEIVDEKIEELDSIIENLKKSDSGAFVSKSDMPVFSRARGKAPESARHKDIYDLSDDPEYKNNPFYKYGRK